MWSVYGDDKDEVITKQVVLEVVASVPVDVPVVIGGDFNASPAQVAGWLEDYPELEVCSTGTPCRR